MGKTFSARERSLTTVMATTLPTIHMESIAYVNECPAPGRESQYRRHLQKSNPAISLPPSPLN